jgi:hypothetical protein
MRLSLACKVNRSRPEGIFAGMSCADLPTPSNQPGIDLPTEQALIIYDEPSSTQESDLCHAP